MPTDGLKRGRAALLGALLLLALPDAGRAQSWNDLSGLTCRGKKVMLEPGGGQVNAGLYHQTWYIDRGTSAVYRIKDGQLTPAAELYPDWYETPSDFGFSRRDSLGHEDYLEVDLDALSFTRVDYKGGTRYEIEGRCDFR